MRNKTKVATFVLSVAIFLSPFSVFALSTNFGTAMNPITPVSQALSAASNTQIISLLQQLITLLTQELQMLITERAGNSSSTTASTASLSSPPIVSGGGGGGSSYIPSTPALPTATLTVSSSTITSGQYSTLTWSSSNATSCTGTGFTASDASGSVAVSPRANATYSISCSGAGGSASDTVNVTVSVPVTTTPFVTCNGATLDGSVPASFLNKGGGTFGVATNPAITPCLRVAFVRPKNVIAIDNNLWVADDRGVTELQQSNGSVIGSWGVATEPFGLSYGGGYIWVATGAQDTILKMDPSTGSVVAALKLGTRSDWVTYAGNAVWATKNGSIIEIDPATMSIIGTLSVGPNLKAITYASGSLWVGSSNGNLYRIDPSTLSITATIPGVSTVPVMAAACSNNTLWVTGQSTITEVNATTNTIMQQVQTGIGNHTYGATCGYGYVWVGSDGGDGGTGDGNLRIIDPSTGTVVKEVQLNGKGIAISLSNGMVWVSDTDADSILGLSPASLF